MSSWLTLRSAPIASALALWLIGTLGTACVTDDAELTATEAVRHRPTDTAAAASSPTIIPTYTASVTPSSTPTPRPTATPAPRVDFSSATILGVSFLDGSRLMVSVTIPGGVEGEYRALVGGKAFDCLILGEYPDRLYCIGPRLNAVEDAEISIFPANSDVPLFVAVFAVPEPLGLRTSASAPGVALVLFGGVLGNSYDPSTVHIKAGDTVEWQGGFASHPLVSDEGLWPTVSSGSTFRFSYTSPGTYGFHCQVHAGLGMEGQVIVSSP